MIKQFSNTHFLLGLLTLLMVSCGSNTSSSEEVSKDTSEQKFNPAGYQKHSDTYDPKVTATDTMYKNKDSVPKPDKK